MAVRSSMDDIITRVRLMISDSAGDNQVFSDQEIQDALDSHRVDQRYLALQAVESIAPGGTVTYLDHWAPVGDWEGDAEVVDAAYNVLTPDSSDYLLGHWTFSSEPSWPVRVTGKSYERFGAAVDLLETWASKVALDFDFSAGGQTFNRSQKQKQLLEMAHRYRAMMPMTTGKMTREDAY